MRSFNNNASPFIYTTTLWKSHCHLPFRDEEELQFNVLFLITGESRIWTRSSDNRSTLLALPHSTSQNSNFRKPSSARQSEFTVFHPNLAPFVENIILVSPPSAPWPINCQLLYFEGSYPALKTQCDCEPASLASAGFLLQMQHCRPHPDLLNQNLHFYKIPSWCMCTLKSEKHISSLSGWPLSIPATFITYQALRVSDPEYLPRLPHFGSLSNPSPNSNS